MGPDGSTLSAGNAAAKAGAAETIGKGSTSVAMLLPLSAPGARGESARNMKDAAKLAVEDLGSDLLTVTIHDTAGQDDRARKLALSAVNSKAALVVGPVETQAAQQLAAIKGKRTPVLALADNFTGGTGVFAVPLSEAESAAAGAAALADQGARKFALVVPEGPAGDAVEKRVAISVKNVGAKLAVTLRYGPTTSPGLRVVDDLAALGLSLDAIVLAAGEGDPTPLAAALRAKGLLKGSARLVGTSQWMLHDLSDPALDGAMIAALDPFEQVPVAARFEAKYGRAYTVEAAYAYDTIALAAGIASALGPNGITGATLETPTGFRGSTGVFRFRSDGSSERKLSLFSLSKGQPKLVRKAKATF